MLIYEQYGREEFSSYIYNIYNVLRSQEQWVQNPYGNCLKNVYRNTKLLSKSFFTRRRRIRSTVSEPMSIPQSAGVDCCEYPPDKTDNG